MADFVERNSLIATDEVRLTNPLPPLRGSAEWLAALSEEVTHELSDSLTRQETAKKVAGIALLELDAVIGKMRSHTRSAQGPRSKGSAPVSAFKPSALAAYRLKTMAELVPEPSSLSDLSQAPALPQAPALQSSEPQSSELQSSEPQSSEEAVSVVDSVRASWPVNWSVLRAHGFRVPRLKVPDGGNPSPSV